MSLGPGEEFRSVAAPSQELLRKLAYLATQDNDSVLTGGIRSIRDTFRGADSRKAATSTEILLQLTRLADPAYQAASARITEKLDRMDESSVIALQDIEQELRALRREREKMLEQAYRDEQGRRIFMTKDGSAAYYEDGTMLDDDEFALHREQLESGPRWEEWQDMHKRDTDLLTERDLIHRHEAACQELRDALAEGSISQEEAERRERELEEALPERVREHFRRLRGETAEHGTGADPHAATNADADLALSTEEQTALNTGLTGPGFTPG